jgi:hypothetical protein
MAAGIIAVNTIPGWPNPADGLTTAARSAGITWSFEPDGLHVSDVAASNALISSYSGSAAQLAYSKTQKQIALDALFDANFDLAKFIRGGTSTAITAANVGTFLAAITNNYRSLRANIAAAASVSAVLAININSGWPSNP